MAEPGEPFVSYNKGAQRSAPTLIGNFVEERALHELTGVTRTLVGTWQWHRRHTHARLAALRRSARPCMSHVRTRLHRMCALLRLGLHSTPHVRVS